MGVEGIWDLGKKLAQVREAAGLSRQQLVERLGRRGYRVKTYTVSKWETDVSKPSVEVLLAVCYICRVRDILLAFTGPRVLRLYDIPASAGAGSFLEDGRFEMIEVDSAVPEAADYAVKVSGDSMTPRFLHGQIIFLHEQAVLCEGEIGVFGLNGDAYLKKLGRDTLVSLNPAYAPIPIREFDDFRVFGKVVG